MDHDQLQFDLRQSASIRLLKSPHAPLIISFLHRVFKQEQRAVLPYADLLERLDLTLDLLNERTPNLYPLSATAYLKQWSDDEHELLRITVRGSDAETTVELTVEAERAIGWIEELYRHEFVGTESRFLAIFQLIEEIVARSNEDVTQRIAQLEQERAAIEAEIARIRASGRVEPLTSTQVKERFLQAGEVARQLLRDFATVEQNFRGIARNVQEQQLQPEARKGTVVEYVLDADAALYQSDQGRSFYAFWEFLTVPDRQDSLRQAIEQMYSLPILRELASQHPLLRRLSRSLLEAGEKIVQSNHRLAEQVRRLIDDRALAESRRVRELIGSIKFQAARLAETPASEGPPLWLEGPPMINLPLEKPLWELQIATVFELQPQMLGTLDDATTLALLYRQFYVDEYQLQQQIETLLENQPQCSLRDVLEIYPAAKGLAEVIAYLTLARRDARHTIDDTTTEFVTLPATAELAERTLAVPQVIFRSAYAS